MQHESKILECLDKDFLHMGRCKMALLLPKTGYNKYSELFWPSYVHFNSRAAFGVGSIGDVPSHPTLVGTCFTFINFSIAAFGFGYLETCPPTPGYVGTCYFIRNKDHGYGSSTNIEVHLLGRTLSVSQLVTSITGYLYPRIFMVMGHPQTHTSSKSIC